MHAHVRLLLPVDYLHVDVWLPPGARLCCRPSFVRPPSCEDKVLVICTVPWVDLE